VVPQNLQASRLSPVLTPFVPWQQQPPGRRRHKEIDGCFRISEDAFLSIYCGALITSPSSETVAAY
jgi:hypothetical protein